MSAEVRDSAAGFRNVPVGELPGSIEGQLNASVDLPVPPVALAVGAHPDDIEFGCGATLAKWAAQGCRIHHLVLTDGSKGTWDPSADTADLVKVRKEEQIAAAQVLGGGDVSFLEITDGELSSDLETRRRVCEVIRRVRPQVLLGHDPWRRYRLHPDHRHAGWLVTDGLVAARDPKFFPGSGEPHRPLHLLLWEADQPDHVEEVSAYAATKIAALLAHASQHLSTMGIKATAAPDGDHARREQTDAFADRVRSRLAEHGKLAGVAAGEAFHRMDHT